MAALIDADYLRDTFNIHDEVRDERITPYIAAASRRLLGWVGATNYAETEIVDELKLAEGLIAMHLLVLSMNTAIRPNGLVRRETVENNVVVEYLSQTEMAAAASAYLEQASEIVRVWNQSSDAMPVPTFSEADADEYEVISGE